jgi:hypothetical protein
MFTASHYLIARVGFVCRPLAIAPHRILLLDQVVDEARLLRDGDRDTRECAPRGGIGIAQLVLEHMGPAFDRVEGGAQLVAHGCEELLVAQAIGHDPASRVMTGTCSAINRKWSAFLME